MTKYSGSHARAIVEGEFLLTADDFRRIAAMIRTDAGIILEESKATLVYSRLAKRLRNTGLKDFAAYCDLVSGDHGAQERAMMLAALTTNVTRFFREPHHFDHLKTKILPPLLEKVKRGGRLRLWSAACSNGQEPYSIALVILSLLPNAADCDVRILATDIDPNMVAEGNEGVYPQSVLDAVPTELRRKWFQSVDGDGACYAVSDEMRKLTSFRQMNLNGKWPMKGRFDAIFCRNVVIYFDEATQFTLWSRMVSSLEPGGTLYIGHSERVGGPASNLFYSDGVTTYRTVDREITR